MTAAARICLLSVEEYIISNHYIGQKYQCESKSENHSQNHRMRGVFGVSIRRF